MIPVMSRTGIETTDGIQNIVKVLSSLHPLRKVRSNKGVELISFTQIKAGSENKASIRHGHQQMIKEQLDEIKDG